MTLHFINTMRSLERNERRGSWLLLALGVLAAAGVWLGFARVAIYASSTRARVEMIRIVNRVSAQDDGRLVGLSCKLGQRVRTGDLLAVLDSSVELAQLERERSVLAGLVDNAAAVTKQVEAEQAKRSARLRLDDVATQQARLGVEQARVAAEHQLELTSIARDLHQRNVTSRSEAVQSGVDLRDRELRLDDASLELERRRASREFENLLAELSAQQQERRAAVSAVLAQIGRRTLRAPTNGRLGSIAALQAGDVVKAGDVITTIVPRDDVHVVAEFLPDEALGRILPGRQARVRLDGFSWVEYGALRATVARVANEPSTERVRVELVLDSGQETIAPIQHGLPASVDIALELTSPWAIVTRSVGSRLAPKRSEPSAAGGRS